MTREFWRWWLLAATAGSVLLGLVMVVLPAVAERAFAGMLFGTAEYPFGPGAVGPLTTAGAADPAAYARFVTAVLGAVMVGWGVVMACLVTIPMRRGVVSVWRGKSLQNFIF